MTEPPPDDEPPAPLVLPLLSEQVEVAKRRNRRRVRVRVTTRERHEVLHETLVHERVEINHVPIGKRIDAVPPARQEGDVTILPVVEERVVVQRYLYLVEEIRVRTVRETSEWNDTVLLRYQDVEIDGGGERELHRSGDVGSAPNPGESHNE